MEALNNKGGIKKSYDRVVPKINHKRARSDLLLAKPKRDKFFGKHRRQVSIQEQDLKEIKKQDPLKTNFKRLQIYNEPLFQKLRSTKSSASLNQYLLKDRSHSGSDPLSFKNYKHGVRGAVLGRV